MTSKQVSDNSLVLAAYNSIGKLASPIVSVNRVEIKLFKCSLISKFVKLLSVPTISVINFPASSILNA